jgi:hypothetical protein
MLQLNSELKEDIINKLKEIISIDQNNWNNLDIKLKVKLIHHYCNFIETSNLNNKSLNNKSLNNKSLINDIKIIPLKSIKPKKLVQYSCFNKQYNKKLYNEYLNNIKEVTFNFRNLFTKSKVHHTFNSLPRELYNEILNSYNKTICDFLIKNKNLIITNKLYNNLIGNNDEKIISNIDINTNNESLEIIERNNKIEFIFNDNIHIILELFLTSNKITNNIPVKFNVKIINKF